MLAVKGKTIRAATLIERGGKEFERAVGRQSASTTAAS